MANLTLPFSGEVATADIAFNIQCDGGGIAIEGKSAGFDEQGQGGIGVFGWCDGGAGVVGQAVGFNQDEPGIGVAGSGPIGVQGTASNAPGGHGGEVTPDETYGVVATNDAGTALSAQGKTCGAAVTSDEGIGLIAKGAELAASFIGDVAQSRANGGCIKAMVYLSTGEEGTVRVLKRYYQSQRGLAKPTVYRLDTGIYSIDFHFQVSDRYVTVTPFGRNNTNPGSSTNIEGVEQYNPNAPLWYPPIAPSVSGVQYVIANVVLDGLTQSPGYGTLPPPDRVPATTMVTVMTYKPVLLGSGGSSFVNGFSLTDADFSVAIY